MNHENGLCINNFYTYRIEPLDFGWDFLTSVKEHLKDIVASIYSKAPLDTETPINDFLRAYRSATETAKLIGWEGDFRNDPCVTFVPDGDYGFGGLARIFIFKQDNNGDTFVLSEVRLNYLEG